MKTIKSYLKLFFVLSSFSSVIAQRSIIVQDHNQQVSDIAKHPDGYFILASTNHLELGNRMDVQIAHCFDNVEVSNGVSVYHHEDFNLISGNLSVGPEYLDLGYPTDAAFTATALYRVVDISGEIGPRSLIAHIDYNVPIQPDWALSTNVVTEGPSKCLRLPDGDFIFLYNYTNSDLVTLPALSRITSTGVIVWEKSYELNKDHGVDINFNYANDMCLLSDNSIVVTGGYAFDIKSLKPGYDLLTPFAFKINFNGRLDWVRSFQKIGLSSAEFVSVRQSPHSGSIYFVGSERLTRIPRHNIIKVASLSLTGAWLSQHEIQFTHIIDPFKIVPSQFDIADRMEILGIVGRFFGPTSSTNFYLRFNPAGGHDLWSELNFIIPNGESQNVIRKAGVNRFITSRNVLGGLAGGISDICIEKIDFFGNDSPCYSGGSDFPRSTWATDQATKKHMHARNIDNLIPFGLNQTITFNTSDYCGRPSDLMVGQGNKIQSKSLNRVSELSPNIAIYNGNQLNISDYTIQNETGLIEIMDLFGRVIMTNDQCVGNCNIDISQLQPGVYFVWNPIAKKKLLGKFVKS